MSQPLQLSAFFENGKMDADFEIGEGYVAGLCVLYAQRTAKDQEYMIRDRSIVMTEGRDLSQCVQMAKDLACRSALSRLSALPAVSSAVPQWKPAMQETPPVPAVSGASADVTAPSEEAAPMVESAQSIPLAGDEQSVLPEGVEEPFSEPQREEEPFLSGARQVGLADLRPASSLLTEEGAPQRNTAPKLDEEDEALSKARNMRITILGKLHECSGWTAGKILEERPEVIVEFANRYNGPKVEERDALRALYTEALQRIDRAA